MASELLVFFEGKKKPNQIKIKIKQIKKQIEFWKGVSFASTC